MEDGIIDLSSISPSLFGIKGPYIPRHTTPYSDETKRKLRNANLGKKHSEETKALMVKVHTGVPQSKETLKKRSESLMGKPQSKVGVERMRQTKLVQFAGPDGPRLREACRQSAFRSMALAKEHPNTSEIIFGIKLEESFPGVFEYTGDGNYFVGDKNPDYTSFDRQFIIELFGNGFHSSTGVSEGLSEEDTIKFYKDNGKACLVIWDGELKQEDIESKVSILLAGGK